MRDNGIGIDNALLPHVFELFTQGERSLDRSQGGLGVGLTVVERLVDLHQGRVEVKSDGLGKGSLFRVVLPCISEVPQADAAPQSGVARRSPDGRQARAGGRRQHRRGRKHRGVPAPRRATKCRTVSDGPQAVAIAQVFAPQIAVVDIGLPGMNGYEVARRLRLRGSRRRRRC